MKRRLTSYLSLAWQPIRANGAFFAFMFVLGLFCTQTELPTHLRNAKPYELSAVELFFDLYIVCALLTLLPRKVRPIVRLLTTVVLYATAVADVFCYVRFDSTLTPTMLMLCDETTSQEASEFFSSYVGWDVLSTLVGGVLLIALLYLLWSVGRWWLHTHHPHQPRLKPEVVSIARAVMGTITLALFVYCACCCWPNKQATVRLMTLGNMGAVEHELTLKGHANLYLPIYRLLFSWRANSLANQQTSRLMKQTEQISVDSCDFRSPKIVLIIGESYNRHRSQLYGYERATTPRQLERMNDSTLVVFSDVVAPWNLTSYVFKLMMSLYSVGDNGEWCDYPLFPQLFRAAGYHVTFLTNQFLPKAGEAVYDFSGGFFLNHPTLSRKLFDTRNSRTHRYDEGLLADYDALDSTKQQPHELTIFHLMGQHVDYRGRFPVKTRRHFAPSDYKRTDLSEKRQQINADYDNAVLYNDSVVDQILRRFEQQEAIIIYVPDHGEECFNGTLPFYGRMHSANIDRRLAREEFEIPFWIWASESYRQRHSQEWETIRRSRHQPFMTDRLPHMLLHLAGIHTHLYQPALDVLSPQYNTKRPRLLKNSVDYNQLIKQPTK